MRYINKDLYIKNSDNRKMVCIELIKKFFDEEMGTSSQSTYYEYKVETLKDNNYIYIRRPAPLHNGFDFRIGVSNYKFNNSSSKEFPSHENLISDLIIKLSENKEYYQELCFLIERIFKCEEIDFENITITFKNGYSVELILKLVKWFFIEQDIRYWNKSGRYMLFDRIKEITTQK